MGATYNINCTRFCYGKCSLRIKVVKSCHKITQHLLKRFKYSENPVINSGDKSDIDIRDSVLTIIGYLKNNKKEIIAHGDKNAVNLFPR